MPRYDMVIPPHPLNGATKEFFTYLSREEWEVHQEPAFHEMNLREAPFRAVASGRKVIEMRLFDPKRQVLRVGDEIKFSLVGGDESVTALVTGLHYFPSFAALYEAMIPVVGAVGLGYSDGDTPDPADMLEYYSEDAITRFGVVGIEIGIRH